MIGLPYGEKNYDDMLSRFHTIPACHGRTDRQTDGRTDGRTELLSIHPFIYIRQLGPYHTNIVKNKVHTYTQINKQYRGSVCWRAIKTTQSSERYTIHKWLTVGLAFPVMLSITNEGLSIRLSVCSTKRYQKIKQTAKNVLYQKKLTLCSCEIYKKFRNRT